MATTTVASKSGASAAARRAGLTIREFDDGRTSADGGVMFADDLRTLSGDEFCERLAGESGAHEIDDFGIAEKIIEEGLDGGERVGAAQLEEDYGDFFARGHSLRCLPYGMVIASPG